MTCIHVCLNHVLKILHCLQPKLMSIVNGIADITLYEAFKDISTIATAFRTPRPKYEVHSYFSLPQNNIACSRSRLN
jgi:hypothetical protein